MVQKNQYQRLFFENYLVYNTDQRALYIQYSRHFMEKSGQIWFHNLFMFMMPNVYLLWLKNLTLWLTPLIFK